MEMHFDSAALARLCRFGGVRLVDEMVEIFRQSVPERLGHLRAGLSHGDAPRLRLTFHSLKSSSAQLGAMHLSDLSRRGEELAARGDAEALGALAPLVDTVNVELARALEWMERARQELANSSNAGH